jgi:CRP-like cAMP-binding protein
MIKHALLFKTLNQVAEIPPEQWLELCEMLEERTLKKGQFFLKEGDQANNVGFIISGYCRQFYVDSEGSEFNHGFNFENELMAGYPSLLERSPCRYTIEAMEDCELLVMPYEDFDEFYSRHPCWERLGRKVAERNYLLKMRRESAFLILDATQRYLDVLETQPEVIKRVPQYQLASFLGITASALNRIIKKLKSGSGV